MAEGADRRAGLHRDARAEDHVGFDHRIAADHGVMGKEHGLGGDQGDATVERLTPHTGLEHPLGPGETRTTVHAQRFVFVTGYHRHPKPAGPRQAHDICQIVFARRIFVVDFIDQFKKELAVGHGHPAITKSYGALFG